MPITGNAKPPRTLVVRRETLYPAIITNTIYGILNAENVDARVRMTEFSTSMDAGLSLGQQYDFWSKFWFMSHTLSLGNFDQESQEKIKAIREYATERMNSTRSAYHPRY